MEPTELPSEFNYTVEETNEGEEESLRYKVFYVNGSYAVLSKEGFLELYEIIDDTDCKCRRKDF